MINSILKSSSKSFCKITLSNLNGELLNSNQATNNLNNSSIASLKQKNLKIKYYYARKVTNSHKPLQVDVTPLQQMTKQSIDKQLQQTQSSAPNTRLTEFYTFTNLQTDLSTFQQYLNIYNTHTKKAHQKLYKNQLKIIQSIINQNRPDLILKFLSTNYRNRLANPSTIDVISQYFQKTYLNDEMILEQLLNNKDKLKQCNILFQAMTLLTQFNEMSLFQKFQCVFNKKQSLNPSGQNLKNYLVKVLEKLPSKESQFLFVYNYLMNKKQLPEYFMESQWFGVNTQNSTYQNLGETFYQIRKFVNRYFKTYNALLKENSPFDQLKIFERQSQQPHKRSILEVNIECFLKVLQYPLVRKQILIDGHEVDFIIEPKTISKTKDQAEQVSIKQSEKPLSIILQVMGSYHYTVKEKLKGRDVRKLIILSSKYRKRIYNVKLVHYNDYNKSKGNRNKMQLIKSLIESKNLKINWQPVNKGYDSHWQLKQHYEEFK